MTTNYKSHEIKKRFKPRKGKSNEVGVEIFSWLGSIGAQHYYARLNFYNSKGEYSKIEITRKVVGKPQRHIGALGPDTFTRVGEFTDGFDGEIEAIQAAEIEFNRLFGEGWKATDGHSDESYNFKEKIAEDIRLMKAYQKRLQEGRDG